MAHKIIFITLILIANCYAQYYEASTIVYPIVSGYTEGLKLDERMDHNKELNKKWHSWGFIEKAAGINLGVSIAVDSELDWIEILKNTFLSAVVYWIINDLTINLSRNFNAFRVSNTSSSSMEQYQILKIPLLSFGIWVKYF